MITDINALDPHARYTFADYLQWAFAERVELIRGRLMRMSPAPNTWHQRLVGRFYIAFHESLGNGPCEVFLAPFDVRLPAPGHQRSGMHADTVVQPDLCVVCDPTLLDERGCCGAPDLIVEILSPGNSRKELSAKFDLYESSGVREYWIADPDHQHILAYTLSNEGSYSGSRPYTTSDTLQSVILPGFSLEVSKLFQGK